MAEEKKEEGEKEEREVESGPCLEQCLSAFCVRPGRITSSSREGRKAGAVRCYLCIGTNRKRRFHFQSSTSRATGTSAGQFKVQYSSVLGKVLIEGRYER